ncbi:TonB-dependent receptor plug domain-containing protein [Frigidibacter oleivorans]|uniref:TonB-dependent receptor plug domain-containing protein n=1 Tax=Frigidibacter oleivorans TaxID=2487129 RepID=UPI000F8DE186|nr:TonB-dependent receptor [Frigidibacter oleivorans]
MSRPQVSPLALAAALAAAPFAAPLAAQEATQSYQLDRLLISGGLSPVPADAYGRAYTVVTAEEIASRGFATVAEALRAVPGVSVVTSEPSFGQIRIRGAEANHTLILIDGVEASGGGEAYVLSGLETANIARIEVLRGPQSVFYGSNASAGVINIITDKGTPGLHYGGTVELGEDGSAGSARVSQRGDRGGIAFAIATRDDDGYDVSGDGGEKDGLERTTATLSGDFAATDALTLGFALRSADETYDYDSSSFLATDADSYIVDDPVPRGERDERTGEVWAELSTLDGRLTHRLSYAESTLKSASEDAFGPYVAKGETEALKYRASFGIDGTADTANHLVNVLIDRTQERNRDSYTDWQDKTATSAALEYRAFLQNGLDLQAGIRHDDNSDFKDFTSWNLGASYRIAGTGLRLHGSAGTGMVNPTFSELYGFPGFSVGNPDLQPETNRSLDLGIEATLLDGRAVVDVTLFDERIEDLIATGSCGVDSCSVNIDGETERRGLELAARLQATDTLALRAAYTRLEAETEAGDPVTRAPEHELSLGATLDVLDGRGSLSADLRHVAGLYDTQFWTFPSRIEKLPDYTTVDMAGGFDLTDNVRLTARVTNLLDEDYSESWGYAARGRTGWIGLSANW